MRSLNLALRFVLELCLLGALAYWGFSTGGSVAIDIALGFGAPLLAAAVWGTFIAPKARRRLTDPLKVAVEIDLFTLGALALAFSASIALAMVFALAVALNIALMFVLDQRQH